MLFVYFTFSPRENESILDVLGEYMMEDPRKSWTELLLKKAVSLIEMAEEFNAEPDDRPGSLPKSRYKAVYFSLVFPSNKEMRDFLEKPKII